MTCIPRSGGCERPQTEPFVRFLNYDEGVNFQHVSCLDVMERGIPQPEVLYRDPESEASLVIERKAVVWPPDFAKDHRKHHILMDTIGEDLEEFCAERPITIGLPEQEINNKEQLRKLGHEIAETIQISVVRIDEGNSLAFVAGAGTCRVSLGFEVDTYGTPADSGILYTFNFPQSEKPPPVDLPVEMEKILNKMFTACAKKFLQFSDARRVLALEPCGALWLIDVEWWQSVLRLHKPNVSIDEVWLTFEDQDDTGEAYWSFDLLYSKSEKPKRRSGCIGT